MPKVSVNLCCYNSEPYLEETLASVFGQSFQDFELVIVNDGSKDQTDAIIRRHMDAGRPVIYHAQANAGLGAARNKALELSSGELIAIIDHDDVWEHDKLAKIIPLFDRPQVAFAGSDAVFIDSQGRRLSRYSDGIVLSRGRILKDLFLQNFVPCAAAVMRRSAIAQAGGFFRPDFHIAEEYELFLRLAEKGEFDFIPEPLVRIRVHAASAGWDFRKERLELKLIYSECLRRNPDLVASIGPRLVAVKEAGLWVGPELAQAFCGKGPASLRLKALGLCALACFPGLADTLRDLKRRLFRLAAAR
ncbi:MAG TPA: hypothetical protein DEB40_00085 [Elusimicrobia bacterium]|nr:hypothetical protein [Elusimicrobiota bacterium]HBT60131.1 hypothetical protein [Elusimicrobiota bacterium]